MPARKIILHPHKTLRKCASKVSRFDESLAEIADDMRQTMRAANGIGLAAPQIGILKRLVVVRTHEEDNDSKESDIVAVNPEIACGEGAVDSEEGCLSVPGVRGKIRRAAQVTVRAQSLDGTSMEFTFSDYRAIVFQHEIDHLDGILFFDYMSRIKRNTLLRKYRNLTNTC